MLRIEDKQTRALSDPDTLYVQVSSQAPTVSVIDPPTTAELGEPVTLVVEGSDPDGDELLYRWRGEHVHLLSDSTSATPTFTPEVEQEYHFSVVAIDTDPQESDPAEVVILSVVAPEGIVFADPKLEAAVREAIGIAEGAIQPEDVANLTSLTATGVGIADLSGIEQLTGLRTLIMENNQITDLAPLSSLTSLGDLRLGSNQIEDIFALGSLEALFNLQVGLNRITDISVIQDLQSLLILSIHNNRLTNIDPVEDHPALSRLDLTRNQVEDLTPLADLVSLEWLWISDNPLTDIGPLARLSRLRYLISDRTQIEEISALTELGALDSLTLEDNLIADLSSLVSNVGLNAGDSVDLRGNPLSDEAITTQIPALQERGVEVLFDKPPTSESSIVFADPNLEAVVRDSISKPTGELRSTDVVGLTSFDAHTMDIESIEGIERLISLTWLSLWDNRISDIGVLAGFTEMQGLLLTTNQISDISPLVNLTKLAWLEIADFGENYHLFRF